jgi:catalase
MLVLQARMFAYPDAARYRLGVNYQQLPCNRPVSQVYCPYQRDGAMRYMTNYGDDPNYVRSSLRPVTFRGSLGANGSANGGREHEDWVGKVTAYASDSRGRSGRCYRQRGSKSLSWTTWWHTLKVRWRGCSKVQWVSVLRSTGGN